MALWSVALFGHYKPKVEGWEKRAEPGDIIAVRPFSEHSFWTETERKEFLIVTIDGLENFPGLTEQYWDTDSYPVLPESYVNELIAKNETMDLRPSTYLKKRRFHITLDDLRDKNVDIDKMLDRNLRYDPEIDTFQKIGCFDKLNSRHVKTTDGFNLLAPIKIGKMI